MHQKPEKLKECNELENLIQIILFEKSKIKFNKEDSVFEIVISMIFDLKNLILTENHKEIAAKIEGISRISSDVTIFKKLKIFDKMNTVLSKIYDVYAE